MLRWLRRSELLLRASRAVRKSIKIIFEHTVPTPQKEHSLFTTKTNRLFKEINSLYCENYSKRKMRYRVVLEVVEAGVSNG